MADTLRLLLQTPHGAQWGSWPATIFASVTGYAALFFVLDRTGVLLPRKKLSRKDELDWNSRVISTINALVLVWGAYVCYMESRSLSREQMVREYTWAPDFFARLFLGYLIYDLTCMLWHFKELGDPTAVLHHLIFAFMTAYVLAHSIMAFPFVWLAFCEISTPSVNLRWHLAVTDHKDGKLYLYNGMLLLFLFFLARVLLYGVGLLHLATLRDVWAGPKANPNDKWVVAAFVAGYALNLYWFRAIAKAAQRALKRSKAA